MSDNVLNLVLDEKNQATIHLFGTKTILHSCLAAFSEYRSSELVLIFKEPL